MGNFPLRNSSMSINWTRCSEEKRRMGGKKGTKVGKGPPPAYLTRRRLCIFFLREIYLASCLARVLQSLRMCCEEIWRVIAFISTIFPPTIHNALHAGDKSV